MGGSEPGPAGAGSDGGVEGTPGTPPEGRRRLLVAAVAVTAVLVVVAGVVTWRVSARGPDTEVAIIEPEPEPVPEVVVEPPARTGPRRTTSIGRGDERVVVTTTTTTTTLPPPETQPPPPTAAPETTATTTTTTLPPVAVHLIGEVPLASTALALPGALGPGWAVTTDPDAVWPATDWGPRLSRPEARAARVVVLEACTGWSAGATLTTIASSVQHLTRSTFGGAERVVWVTCDPRAPHAAEVNTAILSEHGANPRAAVADWRRLAAGADLGLLVDVVAAAVTAPS